MPRSVSLATALLLACPRPSATTAEPPVEDTADIVIDDAEFTGPAPGVTGPSPMLMPCTTEADNDARLAAYREDGVRPGSPGVLRWSVSFKNGRRAARLVARAQERGWSATLDSWCVYRSSWWRPRGTTCHPVVLLSRAFALEPATLTVAQAEVRQLVGRRGSVHCWLPVPPPQR